MLIPIPQLFGQGDEDAADKRAMTLLRNASYQMTSGVWPCVCVCVCVCLGVYVGLDKYFCCLMCTNSIVKLHLNLYFMHAFE